MSCKRVIVSLSGPSYVLAAGVRRLVIRIDVCGIPLQIDYCISRNQSGNQTNLTEKLPSPHRYSAISTSTSPPAGSHTPECPMHLFIHKGTARRLVEVL